MESWQQIVMTLVVGLVGSFLGGSGVYAFFTLREDRRLKNASAVKDEAQARKSDAEVSEVVTKALKQIQETYGLTVADLTVQSGQHKNEIVALRACQDDLEKKIEDNCSEIERLNSDVTKQKIENARLSGQLARAYNFISDLLKGIALLTNQIKGLDPNSQPVYKPDEWKPDEDR